MENLFRKSYLSENALKRVEKFQYNGTNISYLYNCVLSPLLDNYFMKIVPIWLAPNLIINLSFVFNFLSTDNHLQNSIQLRNKIIRICSFYESFFTFG